MKQSRDDTFQTFLKAIGIVALVAAVAGAIAFVWPTRATPERFVYRAINGFNLSLDVYRPTGWATTDSRPAVVWFFGGGWEVGGPLQFSKQAERISQLGLVAFTPDYRVRSRHGKMSTPLDSVADAEFAVRWIRDHANELGIDANRIAVGGGSSGGQLAAACAVLQSNTIDQTGGPDASYTPNALILYNPVLDFEIPAIQRRVSPTQMTSLGTISPIHQMKQPLPPTIIFHGTADSIVPIRTSENFVKKARELGSETVELIRYPGKAHEFYLNGPGSRSGFNSTMDEVKEFLTRLGWLKK